MPKTQWFNKDKSLTKLLVTFLDNGEKRTFYSNLKLDEKGIEYGIQGLRSLALKNKKKILNAAIFDNQINGEMIEQIILKNEVQPIQPIKWKKKRK